MPHPFPDGGEGSPEPEKNNPTPVPEQKSDPVESFPSNGNGDQTVESDRDDGFTDGEKTGLNLSADADPDEKKAQPPEPEDGKTVVHKVEIVDDSDKGENEKKRSAYLDGFFERRHGR